jgi:hypothetical protein
LNLLVVGLALGSWRAWYGRKDHTRLLWSVAIVSLPFLTIVSQGFLGYGASALITIVAFLVSFGKWRPRVAVLTMVVFYLGLSLYVTYMRDRTAIREVVWAGEGMGSRVERLYETVSTLEWFNPGDVDHLQRIDERLNQNTLVGVAVDRLESGVQDYAWGETVWYAVIALVPRALWPDKPVVAGSMGLVGVYTGIAFDDATSVGLGQVLELYINFGAFGVIVGFLVFGSVIRMVDVAAARRVLTGQWPAFALWYLPGISLLQAGGSLVEVTSGAAAAIVAAMLVNQYVVAPFSLRRRRSPLGPPRTAVGNLAGRGRPDNGC